MSEERLDILKRLPNFKMSRRLFVGAMAGTFAASLLAACGGDDDDEETPEAAAPTATTAGQPAAEPTATQAAAEATEAPSPETSPTSGATGSPTSGQSTTGRTIEITQFDNPPPGEPSGSQPDELVMAWGGTQFTSHGIDPQLHIGGIAESQLRHIYEPLVKYERDLTTVAPVLATAWERVDDLTMQFQLREGVSFHNGEPFNAEAVRYSILRPLSDETPGDARSIYASITDVEVVDEYTVNVITRNPDPGLLPRMSGLHTNIVPPEWASQGPEVVAREAYGTGPYKFVSWSPNEDLVVEANEDYWGGAPSIKKVRMTTIVEPSTRVAAVLSGEVHIAKDISIEEIENINSSDRARALRAVSQRVPFYFITVEAEPYNDPKVRQAINYAANVDGVIQAILAGNGERVSTVMAKWDFGFDPTLEPYPNDPERAKELLAEAGYPDGIDIDIWFRQGRYPKDKEVAEGMAQEMAKGNIRCTPHLIEPAVLTEMQQNKETPGLVFASWGNIWYDADFSLVPLFGCEQWNDVQDWTRPYGCNEDFEEIIQAARSELDVERRQQLYAEAQRFLYDDGAALFMYQLVDIFGVNNWVTWEPRHDEMMWAHEMEWNA